jgi:anti-sigma regulatory factor (Ser/Thr protein kinase)
VSDPLSYVLTVPSDPVHLPAARSFVVAVCQASGLDAAGTDAVALAVHEALHNVIRHAHQLRSEVPLQLRCLPCADGIEVQILDEGEPFDLQGVPHMDPGEVRLGGRGVFLMRKLTDELSCQPRGTRGNVLRLVKRSPAKTPPATGG